MILHKIPLLVYNEPPNGPNTVPNHDTTQSSQKNQNRHNRTWHSQPKCTYDTRCYKDLQANPLKDGKVDAEHDLKIIFLS